MDIRARLFFALLEISIHFDMTNFLEFGIGTYLSGRYPGTGDLGTSIGNIDLPIYEGMHRKRLIMCAAVPGY